MAEQNTDILGELERVVEGAAEKVEADHTALNELHERAHPVLDKVQGLTNELGAESIGEGILKIIGGLTTGELQTLGAWFIHQAELCPAMLSEQYADVSVLVHDGYATTFVGGEEQPMCEHHSHSLARSITEWVESEDH